MVRTPMSDINQFEIAKILGSRLDRLGLGTSTCVRLPAPFLRLSKRAGSNRILRFHMRKMRSWFERSRAFATKEHDWRASRRKPDVGSNLMKRSVFRCVGWYESTSALRLDARQNRIRRLLSVASYLTRPTKGIKAKSNRENTKSETREKNCSPLDLDEKVVFRVFPSSRFRDSDLSLTSRDDGSRLLSAASSFGFIGG